MSENENEDLGEVGRWEHPGSDDEDRPDFTGEDLPGYPLDATEGGTAPNKRRHGCLTAWLALTVVTNGGVALVYLLNAGGIGDAIGVDASQILVLGAIATVNVVCAIALLRWRKWGFWGFVVSSLVVFAINLLNGVVFSGVFGLVGILVLWAVLQSGNPKAWDQLE